RPDGYHARSPNDGSTSTTRTAVRYVCNFLHRALSSRRCHASRCVHTIRSGMTVRQAVQQQFDGLQKMLVGFANIPDALEEHLFASIQVLALATINSAIDAIGQAESFNGAQQLIETIVRVAERDNRDLATEITDLIARMNAAGIVVTFERPVKSKAL